MSVSYVYTYLFLRGTIPRINLKVPGGSAVLSSAEESLRVLAMAQFSRGWVGLGANDLWNYGADIQSGDMDRTRRLDYVGTWVQTQKWMYC